MRKLVFLIMLMAGIVCLVGCWDRRELDKLAIVTGFAIDQAEDKDKIKATAQIIKPGEIRTPGGGGGGSGGGSGGGKDKPYLNVTNTGDTFFETLRRFTHFEDRRLYLPHNEVLVFGDQMARTGVQECIDIFIRDAEPRLTTWIVVAKGEAGEVLDVKAEFEKIPAMNLSMMIEGYAATSELMASNLNMFSQRLMSKTTAPVASLVQVEGTGEDKKMHLVGTAVFKRDKLVGYLTLMETRGLLWVLSKVQSGIIVVQEPDGKGEVSLEILRAKGEISPGMKDDGTPYIMVKIKEEANLGEERGVENLMSTEAWTTLEDHQAGVIRHEVKSALAKAQQLNADVFGFGEEIYKKYPAEWKKIEPYWDEIFPILEVKIAVEADLRRTGMTARPAVPEAD